MAWDWDRINDVVGEGARPFTMALTGLVFSVGVLVPFVTVDKITACGVVLMALFAVKGQDKRAEIRANGEVEQAKVKAASVDRQTAAVASSVDKATEASVGEQK